MKIILDKAIRYYGVILLLNCFVFTSCTEKQNSIFEAQSPACNACGKCVEVCPQNAISITQNKAVIDLTKCTKCGKCAVVCPNDAIN